ncbi:MAG: hypothetical protein IPH12_13895 [Saprospirales bacterium]|nr:hypothetical protein [Saprospirales bacterium]
MQMHILSDTRAKCWRAWQALPLLLLVLLFVQTVTGRLAPEAPRAWLWLFAGLLPGLAVLLGSMLLNRHPAKLIVHPVHQALVWSTWFYLSLLLLTPLAEPFAQFNGQSTAAFLQLSYLWLLPLQALLLAAYFLAFIRKDPIFRPDARLIAAYAEEKAGRAESTAQKQVLGLVAAGDLSASLALAAEYLEKTGSADLPAVVVLRGQLASLQRHRDMNLIDPDAAQRQLNRIAMSLLNMTGALKT